MVMVSRAEVEEWYPILKYFAFLHLPPKLQSISKPFCDLAYDCAMSAPRNAEIAEGLRKLLEAKDCVVRGNLD
jgi:hypothetical protein